MKRITLIVLSIILVHSIIAQTDSSSVLLENISGIYKGNIKNGLANGKGKSIGKDTYIGTFRDGLPHGRGKYIFNNGDIFNGNWENGQKNGKGKFEYTLNGEKRTLIGYWQKDEYVGVTEPDISYRITSASGIINYKVEKNESANKHDNQVTFSIKSSFTDYAPADLKTEISSGQMVQNGKKFSIVQYFCPLRCEISYSILVAETRKQCRFIIEILEEGMYTVTISND